MNVYTRQHSYYCGIYLHSRTMFICVLDAEGKIVFHQNRSCNPESFLEAATPFREGLVVGVECIFCWYWLADQCAQEGIDFILGHALYMRAIHGVKTKNNKLDSLKIARLIRGGNFPLAYVIPTGNDQKPLFMRHIETNMLGYLQSAFHDRPVVRPPLPGFRQSLMRQYFAFADEELEVEIENRVRQHTQLRIGCRLRRKTVGQTQHPDQQTLI